MGPCRTYIGLFNLTRSSLLLRRKLGEEIRYVLAFSADKIEDVARRYTLQWEAIQQLRLKNKKNTIDFLKVYCSEEFINLHFLIHIVYRHDKKRSNNRGIYYK
jgi:hypothetical protein